MMKVQFITLLFISSVGFLKAQHPHAKKEDWMQKQIKTTQQFIEIFNHKNLRKDSMLVDTSKFVGSCKDTLWQLFDQDNTRFKQLWFKQQVDDFTDFICENNVKIAPNTPLTALAPCIFEYQSKQDTLYFRLEKYIQADSASYWDVKSVVFPKKFPIIKTKAIPKDSLITLFLPPTSHELSFFPLLTAIEKTKTIIPYTSHKEDSSIQQFGKLIQTNQIELISMESPFLFFDFKMNQDPFSGHWLITLENILREKENSGWLITNVASFR